MKNNVSDLFNRYRRKLFLFIADRVPLQEDAEDILQDVFLRFLQAEETSPVLQASGWLYKVARNCIIDKSRKKQDERMPQIATQDDGDTFVREVTEVLVDEEQSPEKEYLRALVWEQLEDALDELPQEQKYVFEETELKGVSFKELSVQTHLSVETLLSRKHYAVKFLRKRLKSIYEELLSEE